MTNKEAIQLLLEMQENCLKVTSTDPKRYAKSDAITVAIEAIEQNEPKAPKYLTYDEVDFVDEREDSVLYPVCKICDCVLDKELNDFCPVCGQAIDWGAMRNDEQRSN